MLVQLGVTWTRSSAGLNQNHVFALLWSVFSVSESVPAGNTEGSTTWWIPAAAQLCDSTELLFSPACLKPNCRLLVYIWSSNTEHAVFSVCVGVSSVEKRQQSSHFRCWNLQIFDKVLDYLLTIKTVVDLLPVNHLIEESVSCFSFILMPALFTDSCCFAQHLFKLTKLYLKCEEIPKFPKDPVNYVRWHLVYCVKNVTEEFSMGPR